MSVCNLSVTTDRILMITDTLVYRGNEPLGQCDSKVYQTLNGRVAWTYRGQTPIGETIGNAVDLSSDLAEAAGTILSLLSGEALAKASGFTGIEFTVAGPWDSRNRLAVLRISKTDNTSPPELMEIPAGVSLMPPPPASVRLPETADADLLVKLSLAQWKAKALYTNWGCIGGAMHLTTVTMDGAVVERVGVYPDHDDLPALHKDHANA